MVNWQYRPIAHTVSASTDHHADLRLSTQCVLVLCVLWVQNDAARAGAHASCLPHAVAARRWPCGLWLACGRACDPTGATMALPVRALVRDAP